jgi:hypothetical protein
VTSFDFFVDIIAVFPFEYMMQGARWTKLFRLFRFPQLISLLDLKKLNKFLKSLFESQARKEKILIQYFLIYSYRVFRLILIAIIVTYFTGCCWYYFSINFND